MFFRARYFAARFYAARYFDAATPVAVTTDTGGAGWYPWWLAQQTAARGTLPARAIGDHLELYIEFEPGSAVGRAKSKRVTALKRTVFVQGRVHGAALAGDASAVHIPAIASGCEIAIGVGVVSGLVRASAQTPCCDIEIASSFADGEVKASAIAVGCELDLATTTIGGAVKAQALASGVEVATIIQFRGAHPFGSAKAGGQIIDLATVSPLGKAMGAIGLDLIALDNDLLMLAAA